MLHAPASLTLTVALAVFVLASAMLASWLLARAAHRGERRARRSRAADLFRLFGARLSGELPAVALRAAVRDAEAQHFWDAIEAVGGTLRHRERMALSRALERNRHAAAERRALREEASSARREQAARRLGLLPSARSRGVLRRALVAGPEMVRFAAARSLAAHRDLRALRWLLEHPETLAARPLPALSGLVRAFGPGGRALLIAALERGLPETRFECACLDALGITRCRSARGTIEARLIAPQVERRVAAARALGRLGMGESIPALMLALTDGAWPVRAIAAQALGRLGATPAVEALAPLVGDRAWWVRHHAAYALAALGSEGRDMLCELAARSPDVYAREMAREALDREERRRPA